MPAGDVNRRSGAETLDRVGGDRRDQIAEAIDVDDGTGHGAADRAHLWPREPHWIVRCRPEPLGRHTAHQVCGRRREDVASVERTADVREP